MEPGVSLTLWPPKLYGVIFSNPFPPPTTRSTQCLVVGVDRVPERNSGTTQWTRNIFEGQALGLLVPVGSVYYYLRPPAYQPSRLLGALPG